MNAKDRSQADKLRKLADDLMNCKPMVNPVVRNTDIIEALIGDIALIGSARGPHFLAAEAERAIAAGEMTRPDYLPVASAVTKALGRVFTGF